MEIATVISISISVAAFILSIIALWKTHFAKFRLVSIVGELQIRIYPINHKSEKWYLPTINIPISLTNEGARVGKILGLRIRATFPDLPKHENYQVINPRCEIDYKRFEPNSNQPFKWADDAVIAEWMPYVILPKQTVTKHLVFQSRWEEMIIQNDTIFELEIFTNVKKKWKKIAKWNAALSPGMWNTEMEDVSSFIFPEETMEAIEN